MDELEKGLICPKQSVACTHSLLLPGRRKEEHETGKTEPKNLYKYWMLERRRRRTSGRGYNLRRPVEVVPSSSTSSSDSEEVAQEEPPRIVRGEVDRLFFGWVSVLGFVGIVVFLATMVIIHTDKPFYRAPPGFFEKVIFKQPYMHMLSFHDDTRESSYTFYGKCSIGENENLYRGGLATSVCKWEDSEAEDAARCTRPLRGDIPDGQDCSGVGFLHARGGGGTRKTVSMGIIQHPALAIVGYGLGVGVLLVCATVMSIVLKSWSILVFAFITYTGMLVVLGYAEVGKELHFAAACITITGATVTHLSIIFVLRARTRGGYGVYIAAVFLVILVTSLLVVVVAIENLRNESRFAVLEHIGIGAQVGLFLCAIWEVSWIADDFKVYVRTKGPFKRRKATWTAAQAGVKRRIRAAEQAWPEVQSAVIAAQKGLEPWRFRKPLAQMQE